MSAARPAPWLTQWEYAHRGLHDQALPENSVAAARAAIRRGLGIECDIQMSSDDAPMVFHDWDLDRLTAASGRVAEYTSAALSSMRLCGSDETIVPLASFLASVSGQVPILIELKSRPDLDAARCAEQVARAMAGYQGPFALMSFDPRIVRFLAEQHPAIIRGLVGTDSHRNGFERMWRDQETLSTADPHFLALDRRDLASAQTDRWRAEGRPILTWTIRTPADRASAVALADALICEGEGLP